METAAREIVSAVFVSAGRYLILLARPGALK
jgi:hypothetical protein